MHREIYRAIRSHNPTGAMHAMERHLNMARMAQAAELGDTFESADPPGRPATPRREPKGKGTTPKSLPSKAISGADD